MVTDRHRMSIRQGENWGEFYNLQSDPTEVNNLFDEASAEQIRATLTETMLGQIIELQGWAPLLAYRALVPPGCCRRTRTRIELLVRPESTLLPIGATWREQQLGSA